MSNDLCLLRRYDCISILTVAGMTDVASISSLHRKSVESAEGFQYYCSVLETIAAFLCHRGFVAIALRRDQINVEVCSFAQKPRSRRVSVVS
jgi:hypothetical protein